MKQTHLEELRQSDLQHYDALAYNEYKSHRNSILRAINFYYDYRQMNLFQRIILTFKKNKI
jgi:hypothetical protein